MRRLAFACALCWTGVGMAAEVTPWTYDGVQMVADNKALSASNRFSDDDLRVHYVPDESVWYLEFRNSSPVPMTRFVGVTTLNERSESTGTHTVECDVGDCISHDTVQGVLVSTARVALPSAVLHRIESAASVDISYYAGSLEKHELHWYRFPLRNAGEAIAELRSQIKSHGSSTQVTRLAASGPPVPGSGYGQGWNGLRLPDVQRCAERGVEIEREYAALNASYEELERLQKQVVKIRKNLQKEQGWLDVYESGRMPTDYAHAVDKYNDKVTKLRQVTQDAAQKTEIYNDRSVLLNKHKQAYDKECFAAVKPWDLQAVCGPDKPGHKSPWCQGFETIAANSR